MEEKKKLYDLFGLKAMSNNDDGYNMQKAKKCYSEADIIYGDISNF